MQFALVPLSLALSAPLFRSLLFVVATKKGPKKNPAKNLKRLAKVVPAIRQPPPPPTFTEIAHRQMCNESCKLQVEGYEAAKDSEGARKKLQENVHCVHYNGIINRSDWAQIEPHQPRPQTCPCSFGETVKLLILKLC